MRALVTYFIKYPISGNVIILMAIIFGYFGYKSMNFTLFPEVESRFISIQVTYPGASPEEIEEGIVTKIEDNLKGITGLERVTSTSSENAGSILVEATTDADVDLLLDDVKNAVDRINSFPVGMEPPVVFKRENIALAMSIALNGEVDLKTLKKFARQVENDLRSVKGISKVELTGFPAEEIEISFRENDLRAYNLTFDQAAQAVRRANIEITGGTIKGKNEELLVRAKTKQYYAQELANIVLKTGNNSAVIRLKDVANVTDRWSDNPNRSYYNGKPSVVVNVSNTISEDILYITDYLRGYVEEFNQKNQIVKANIIQDSSIVLRQRIELLVENGIIGGILVVICLTLFLNIYLSLWVAIGIPISFAGMFILLAFSGITINAISLFGMIVVVGILVDDGIVISENIYQHYERGKSPILAAVDGTVEVLPAVFTSVFTTVIAFSSFFFLEGRIGDFFWQMALVVICALGFSLIEAALTLPAHVSHSRAMKVPPGQANKVENFLARMTNFLRDKIYAPILRYSLTHKALCFASFVAALIIVVGMIQGGFIKTTFFPFIERDNVQVSLAMPAGTREHITEKWLSHIEKSVWEVNEQFKDLHEGKSVILACQKKIGPTTYEGSVILTLLDGENRKVKSFEVENALRKKVGQIPESETLTFGQATPFGKPVSVSLLGYNKEELKKAKEELKAELKKMTSLKDITDTDKEGLREINIILKEKAYNLGLQVQDILTQVRQGFFGNEAQRLQRGIDEVRVWVRYQEDYRSSLENLEEMRIRVNNNEFPLKELANISINRGVIAINHLDGKREIKVEADVADPTESVTDLLFFIQDKVVPPILAKYPSVRPSYEGQSKEVEKTGRSAAMVLPIVLTLMIGSIIATFRSFWQTILVVLMIPFGFIGVGFGHWILGMPISIFSGLGMVALIGVMVNDALVLVTAFNQNLKEGKDFDTAVYEAGVSRFRPILLTSLTTVCGLAPLILEKSFQAQFLIPMAISMAFGLIAATGVNLITLPVSLVLFNRLKIYVVWLWEGKKPKPEEVEPAVQELVYEHEA